MSDLVPLSVPFIKGNEWKYVKECLDTGWVSSSGSFVRKFEEAIAAYTGAKYAVSCINGTSALHVSLKIAGVRPGDEVIVPTLTFIAPVNTVRYLDAEPVFMDCDDFYNMDAAKVIHYIEKETVAVEAKTESEGENGKSTDTQICINKKTGKRIAAIVPVHVFGNAADMEKLANVCRGKNIRIVEDATESLGTKYTEGRLAGRHTGTIGDMGCLSFNGNKIITTGGGGMILTDNPEYAQKAAYLTTQAKDDDVRYIHHEAGFNYRLTNIQAAVGVAQLENLDEYLKIKDENYFAYKKAVDRIPGLHLAETPAYAQNNHWMYALRIDPGKYTKNAEKLMLHLEGHRIQTRPVWYLNHLQKPYRNCQAYHIEKAVEMQKKTLNIPCSVNLKTADIQRVIEALMP